jgi:hypothetical protein
VTALCETRREIGLKGVPEPAMRLAHITSKRRRFIGPGGWCCLLANLTQAVSVFQASESNRALVKFIRNRVAQWCAGSRDHARSRREGGGLWSIFLILYFYFNPSGRCFGCAPVVIRDSNVKQVTTQGSVCVEHEKCGSFHVADGRKLDWDGLRDPLKSCILPFPAGRYFSHPVASALRGRCCSGK